VDNRSVSRSHESLPFGSVARSEVKEGSDLDLLVEMEPERSLLDLVAIQAGPGRLAGMPVGHGHRGRGQSVSPAEGVARGGSSLKKDGRRNHEKI